MTRLREFREQVAARLRQQRTTRASLAAHVGITPKHMSQVLQGRISPSPDLAERIATAMGLRIAVIADGDPVPLALDMRGRTPGAVTTLHALGRRLTVEEADRLAQERPPYPPPSDDPAERCSGPTGWHRPQVEDWNRGNRDSACTWCNAPIHRKFADPTWRHWTEG